MRLCVDCRLYLDDLDAEVIEGDLNGVAELSLIGYFIELVFGANKAAAGDEHEDRLIRGEVDKGFNTAARS